MSVCLARGASPPAPGAGLRRFLPPLRRNRHEPVSGESERGSTPLHAIASVAMASAVKREASEQMLWRGRSIRQIPRLIQLCRRCCLLEACAHHTSARARASLRSFVIEDTETGNYRLPPPPALCCRACAFSKCEAGSSSAGGRRHPPAARRAPFPEHTRLRGGRSSRLRHADEDREFSVRWSTRRATCLPGT
jgi:hypothetical protein